MRGARNASVGVALVALVALAMPAGSMARSDTSDAPSRDGTTAFRPRPDATTELAAVRIRNRATLVPLPKFATRPFAIHWVTIRTLEWANLPLNGKNLLSLKRAAGSDSEGIVYKVVDGRRVYSPGNLANDGIRYVDGYVRTGDTAYLDRAVVRAKKLIALSRLSGGARYFPYAWDYATEKLDAPWYSAYSQGFALSLFVRLYRVTGLQTWAERARETAMSFRRLGRVTKPWVAYVLNRRLWLEEYPSATPTHVLNGFNFALFGLYDYERLTRDPAARDLLRGALRTIRSFGTTFRVPGGISYYDLVHRTRHAHYHLIHTWQLRALAAISGDPWYGSLAAAYWRDYH
ncbi:MAG TPA: D-glucuronyl C5-epimerase family protein [Methylomirabilota bacterium]|nr:D-glucuronyl C5-epimerase family protein [Methylomirabilota bacterium]